ncbi:transferrin-like, partial [Photinus pyralis]|uniref:transferrin-like n=1 Tax=Photinus pyralis TaxID=7054 RepID=UPI001266FC15
MYILYNKFPIACVIATLVCLSTVECRTKYQVCVVDGRGSFRKAAKFCPVLDGPDSKVECVIGLDRLDCLRRISKGKADFSVFSAEDLVTASNLQVEVLVTNEMRYTNDEFEYEVVAVVDDEARIQTRYDLRDKRLCHPGYGYEADWTQILANYLEVSTVPQSCNPLLSLTENRISSSSKYFKSACKAGPWVNDRALDSQLKRKYPNLCGLCNSPGVCSTDDKYWGRSGPLLCLTDGVGDITWARLDDVRSHFGLTPGSSLASTEGYSYLCEDGTTIPLNSTTKPCVWVVKPWPVVASKRTSAQEIQEFISSLSHSDNNSWQSALLNLIETYHLTIKAVQPIEAIESYLSRAQGFLSANSFPGCHPPRTIRICTTTNLENAKCSWLREVSNVYGIEPDVDCLKADNKTHCMQGVADNLADVVAVSADMVNEGKMSYKLKTLFYETVANEEEKYVTVAVVRANSGITSFEGLRGKRACFPKYDGVAWNSVVHALNSKQLLTTCPFNQGMSEFFSDSCVPNFPINGSSNLQVLCKPGIYDEEYGAMRCLTHENGDVAFVSKQAYSTFFQDIKEKRDAFIDARDYTILCENNDEPCHLSWAPPGQAMIRMNSSTLWIKDTLDVFLQMDNLFGKNFKSVTTPFT